MDYLGIDKNICSSYNMLIMSIWHQFLYNLGLRSTGKRAFVLDSELVDYVEALAEIERRPTSEIASELLASGLAQRSMETEIWERWRSLSPREQQVAALVCQEYTNRQIAAALVISVDTVKSHMRSILRKYDLRSRGELRMAMEDWDFSAWG